MLKKISLILISIFVLTGCNQTQPSSPSSNDSSNLQEAVPEAGESAQQTNSKYQTYSQASFEANADKKRVLFFHANWCPTCKVANEDFTSNIDQIPEEVVIFKTDYDSETDLKAKYEVTYQHTFVHVDSRGDVISKWNGGGIENLIENLL